MRTYEKAIGKYSDEGAVKAMVPFRSLEKAMGK